MKQVGYWRGYVESQTPPGKRIKTRHHMTREDALARDPTATPVPGSLEVRHIPDEPYIEPAIVRDESTGTRVVKQ